MNRRMQMSGGFDTLRDWRSGLAFHAMRPTRARQTAKEMTSWRMLVGGRRLAIAEIAMPRTAVNVNSRKIAAISLMIGHNLERLHNRLVL